MSLPGAKLETDKNEASSLDNVTDSDYQNRDNITTTAKLETSRQPENVEIESNRFLSPYSAPIRPLSPDTLSNLSVDEYEQLHNGQSGIQSNDDSNSSAELAPPQRFKGRLNKFWVRNKGLAYMLLGQIFGAFMNVATRILELEGNNGKGLHPFQVLFVRMGITFTLATSYMWYKKTPHFPFGKKEVRGLLVARGVGGFFGVYGMYFSLLYLPLADATVITFLSPGLACWACSILLKEPFTRVEQIGTLVSVIGVVLIARPTSLFAGTAPIEGPPANGGGDSISAGNGTIPAIPNEGMNGHVTPMQRMTAVGVALTGALGAAFVYTVLRWIGKRAHPLISVNYFAGWCVIVSITMQIALPDVGFLLPADLKEWGLLIFLGVCGFTMQFLLAAALAYEKSSRATNLIYSQMLFALAFDKIIFGHTPNITSILGSSLILGSAIVVSVQQDPNKGKKDNVSNGDDESRAGLMGGMRDVENFEDHDRLPVQEVHLRTLR